MTTIVGVKFQDGAGRRRVLLAADRRCTSSQGYDDSMIKLYHMKPSQGPGLLVAASGWLRTWQLTTNFLRRLPPQITTEDRTLRSLPYEAIQGGVTTQTWLSSVFVPALFEELDGYKLAIQESPRKVTPEYGMAQQLLVALGGDLYLIEHDGAVTLCSTRGFDAAGSGRDYALGALTVMLDGLDVVDGVHHAQQFSHRAIVAASRFDPGTGSPTDWGVT